MGVVADHAIADDDDTGVFACPRDLAYEILATVAPTDGLKPAKGGVD